MKLKSDRVKRKWFFTAESFPAKCHLGLLEWIISTFTQEGDVILDPLLGSGTTLYATLMGRHVIGIELEDKFCKMAENNLKKLNQISLQLGIKQRGQAQIIQGDARHLENILCDKIITSPPYGEINQTSRAKVDPTATKRKRALIGKRYSDNPNNIGNLPYGEINSIITSPPYEGSLEGGSRHTRGGIPARDKKLGQTGTYETIVDSIITSPPYEASISDNKESPLAGGDEAKYGRWKEGTAKKTSYTQHGEPSKVDSIITSPPYEGSLSHSADAETVREDFIKTYNEGKFQRKGTLRHVIGKMERISEGYSPSKDNIGNLKAASYLSAMFQVYQQCWKVLKPEGLMILVIKPFIKQYKVIHLEEDTKLLAEKAGFTFIEQHHRILPNMSFWRIIYYKKNPQVEKIDKEFVLVFKKETINDLR